jgi:hypothetical protein
LQLVSMLRLNLWRRMQRQSWKRQSPDWRFRISASRYLAP